MHGLQKNIPKDATFTTAEFAELVNRSIRTLQIWASTDKLKPIKDAKGNNVYTYSDYVLAITADFSKRGRRKKVVSTETG